MTDQELIAYFETAVLPEVLRINRAITQYNVKEAVERNLELMQNDPKNVHARHRLSEIKNALEHPYDGPEIPKL
ncbi:DUF6965 family protein [Mucilaginibacter pocheonensis]|uniref:DUF6965 domain-containing protein n=1 Tax=Mucilaginibacter pocheonensis TaxID=398050 RepID=A0ABU1TE51_9SPHI|nr:hypothetical protein [Mucilaginibacter pocheonensis]MDR6943657.1 hypothetical protein [Mucilaginibacter pocheonensis]